MNNEKIRPLKDGNGNIICYINEYGERVRTIPGVIEYNEPKKDNIALKSYRTDDDYFNKAYRTESHAAERRAEREKKAKLDKEKSKTIRSAIVAVAFAATLFTGVGIVQAQKATIPAPEFTSWGEIVNSDSEKEQFPSVQALREYCEENNLDISKVKCSEPSSADGSITVLLDTLEPLNTLDEENTNYHR